ncbi:hypothetical protein [Polyangium sp. y55x31]|uniref:DUF6992 family protein n=1 Tax=Polyangium sp. y55x31 TaxID=3042688 RepID=UPI002482C310|nr:hypothetical protein [Polyangium sp. y55x31]MDI1484210.1 hypothetical protein [Polyangium sp. y55x31]
MPRRALGIHALTLLLAPAIAHADPPAIAPVPLPAPKGQDPAAIAAREAHLETQTRAMTVLTSWAVASIATGAALWATAGDDYTRSIGIQNVAWGAVDGVIAGFGYRGLAKQSGLDKPLSYWQAEDRKARTIFLVNAGLDVLYVTAGALMVGFGKNDWVRGAGAGVALQGSFLFAFDTAMGLGAR